MCRRRKNRHKSMKTKDLRKPKELQEQAHPGSNSRFGSLLMKNSASTLTSTLNTTTNQLNADLTAAINPSHQRLSGTRKRQPYTLLSCRTRIAIDGRAKHAAGSGAEDHFSGMSSATISLTHRNTDVTLRIRWLLVLTGQVSRLGLRLWIPASERGF